jgi:phospholipid/cholesterol/gamma-HCH transport system substrate-binding protein
MPKQQSMRWTDLRVGLLVIAAIAGIIVLILGVSGDINVFKDTMTIYTDLPAAEGLRQGDEVRLAGVRVGSVKEVEFSEIPQDLNAKASVRVRMEVEGDEAQDRIRTDSRAILRQLGLLGGQYVNITPGTLQGDPIREGDTIRGLQEVTIGQVVEQSDDLLAGFKQLTAKLNEITDTINEGRGTIGRFINDESFYVNLNRATLEAQELVRRVSEGEGTAGRLINDPRLYEDLQSTVASLQDVADRISSGDGTVGRLINERELYDRLNSLATRLDTTGNRVDEIVTQVRSGQGTAGKLIYDEKLYQDATATLASIKTVAERLERGEGTAGRLLHDEQLYNNLNQLSSESVKLLYDFRQNPKKYLSIKLELF